MRLALLWLTLAAAVASPRRAAADPSANTVLVIVRGSPKPAQQKLLAEAIGRATADVGWIVRAGTLPAGQEADLLGCVNTARPWLCAPAKLEGIGAGQILITDVRPDGAAAVAVTVQVVRVSGAVPPTETFRCERCTDAELGDRTLVAARAAIKSALEAVIVSGIQIRVIPADAVIELDGVRIANPTDVIAAAPGEHTVQIRRDGYRPHQESVIVTEGKVASISTTLRLVAATGERPPGGPSTGARPVPWAPTIVIAAGAALAVGGVWYSESVDPPDTGEQPKHLYSGPALAVAAVGAAAVVTGGIWLYRSLTRARGSGAGAATPVAAFAPGGAIVGVTGTF